MSTINNSWSIEVPRKLPHADLISPTAFDLSLPGNLAEGTAGLLVATIPEGHAVDPLQTFRALLAAAPAVIEKRLGVFRAGEFHNLALLRAADVVSIDIGAALGHDAWKWFLSGENLPIM